MANPYATPSLGTRWTDKQATTLARLNIARIQADYNTYALQQILDPDNPANGLSAGALLQGFALANVNYTSSAIDAHKIVPFFLDEPAHVSPSFNWRRAIRQTSWYAELGAPPVHGAFVVNAAQDEVEWIDLDSATLAVYMTFNMDSNAIIYGLTSINDIAVMDFKLICAGIGGMPLIDFLEDGALSWNASNEHKYSGDLSERNTGGGFVAYSSARALVNATVNSIAICRDPSGGVDHFGRPLHYWAAGTAGGASLFVPSDVAIYDNNSTDAASPVLILESGAAFYSRYVSASYYSIYYKPSFEGIAADSWSGDFVYSYTDGARGTKLIFSDSFNAIEALAGASMAGGGSPLLIVGQNSGLSLIHTYGASGTPAQANSATILLTSTYVTPYMKGTRVAAYPLDSVTDRSGNSRTLTNNNTVTFTSGVFGNAATFNGTNQYLSITGLSVTVQDPYIACIYTSTTSTNPSDWEYICIVQTSGGDYFVLAVRYDSTGKPSFTVSDDSGSSQDEVYGGPDVCDGNPHQIVGFSDGDNWIIAVDGIKVASVARSNAAGSVDITAIHVGSSYGGGYFLDGQVEMLSIGDAKLTMDEVALEYQRMQAALAGFTTLLTADDIDSVQVAPDGEYAIVTAGDVAHIMDPRTGIILSTDAVGAGTLNDAAIWQRAGADTPAYLLGASTTVEAVQPDERIGG